MHHNLRASTLPPNAGPPPDVVAGVQAAVGSRVLQWRPVVRGMTAAHRWIATLDGGTTVFVKAAADRLTAAWLRAEHRIYSSIQADFLPRLRAWHEDRHRPILVLEDLSTGDWPPPWNSDRVGRVLKMLDAVGRSSCPAGLSSLVDQREQLMGWHNIARNPPPFLALGLASPEWLKQSLPTLLDAESKAQLDGNDLLHGDVKADNICFDGERTLLVDWNWACRGNRRVELAAWLPALAVEGGHPPWRVIEENRDPIVLMCGYWASRAGMPAPSRLPAVRQTQRQKAAVTLAWVCRLLSSPVPLSERPR